LPQIIQFSRKTAVSFISHDRHRLRIVQLRYTTTDRCKLTADKVVATSSPLYNLTFFPTDHQTNLPQTRVITVLEERA